MDRWWQSLQGQKIPSQLHSSMCFAARIGSFGGISFRFRTVSAVHRLQFVDSDFGEIELQLFKKRWVFDHACIKPMLS